MFSAVVCTESAAGVLGLHLVAVSTPRSLRLPALDEGTERSTAAVDDLRITISQYDILSLSEQVHLSHMAPIAAQHCKSAEKLEPTPINNPSTYFRQESSFYTLRSCHSFRRESLVNRTRSLLVKVGKYIGFCVYQRSCLLWPPVIVCR